LLSCSQSGSELRGSGHGWGQCQAVGRRAGDVRPIRLVLGPVAG
jgi:hypothetical protein